MGDVLEATLGAPRRVLDLGCGPGSLALRLLDRFPGLSVVAVDHDPVLLRIGSTALGTASHRLSWVDADLRAPGWDALCGGGRFDAALSTTALHWLTPPELSHLYRTLARRIRPGGMFLNGDHMPLPPGCPRLRAATHRWRRRAKDGRLWAQPGETWEQFWRSVARSPSLREVWDERRRRYPPHHSAESSLTPDGHARRLRAAGFQEVAVLWQHLEDRVLAAVR
jgi:trans-aconitate methyltransferase